MNGKLSNVFAFAVGALIGSAVTWKLVKTKYERIAHEEINSVKEVFSNKKKEPVEDVVEEIEETPVDNEPVESESNAISEMKHAYNSVVGKLGYNHYSKEGGSTMTDKPHIISPDEFDENGYKIKTMFLYADDVLTNDDDKPIKEKDAEKLVGMDALTIRSHFGEYEDDSVFVRNDKLKTDFEILKDLRNYSELGMPHRANG